jgi:hypothetical protein
MTFRRGSRYEYFETPWLSENAVHGGSYRGRNCAGSGGPL